MGRHIAANALTMLIVAFAVLAAVIAWGQHEFTTVGPLDEAICLRVEQGENITSVSQKLADEGAVSNPAVFRIGAQYTDQAGRLRFGAYLIEPGASMSEILEILTRGGASTCGTEVNFRVGVTGAETLVRELDPVSSQFVELERFDWETGADELPAEYSEIAARPDTRFRVTVAEGATSWQVVEALGRAPFLSGEIEEVPPEGMLAPGSYEVRADADRVALIERMQVEQEQLLSDLWAAREEGLPFDSPEEALIMASIIEKETGVAEERRTVASVFVNRLESGMRLQTDPTVIYGITEGREALGRGLRQSELRAESPWNTYVIDGLPSTPIANPGRASIAAALDPADTDYLYFVADGTGGHAFATNLADHNRNVAEWRRIEAERAAEQE